MLTKKFPLALSILLLGGCAHRASATAQADSPAAQLPAPARAAVATSETQFAGDHLADEPSFVQEMEELAEDTPDAEAIAMSGDAAPPALSSDIPLVYNARVQKIINYFQGRGRERFELWLGRSGAYVPMMQAILQQEGLPSDLVYLALIESGFSPYAHSSASAVGYWQFIAPTGLRYGLRIDEWIDERRNPEKATRAAARYLKDLYHMFGDWHLAAAGYNAGENKIARAMRMYEKTSYWDIIEYRYIKPETKDYVPKLIAAITIAKDPKAYGFNPAYQAPADYAIVSVAGGEDLRKLAYAAGVSFSVLKQLNTELKRWMTPPDVVSYDLRVPRGAEIEFHQRLADAPPALVPAFAQVTLGKGETLEKIAARYKVSVADLKLANPNLRLQAGAAVLVPVGEDGTRYTDTPAKPRYATRRVVTVKRGDTISSIARRHGVSQAQLMAYNNLKSSHIRIGQTLKIPGRNAAAKTGKKNFSAKR